MALEGKPGSKVSEEESYVFLQKATPEQLLEIAGGTALRGDPLVTGFGSSTAPTKADELRGRLAKEYRLHADFRGMVERAVTRIQGPSAKPAAAEKADKAAAAKGAEGGKPKKEKEPKKDKEKDKEKKKH